MQHHVAVVVVVDACCCVNSGCVDAGGQSILWSLLVGFDANNEEIRDCLAFETNAVQINDVSCVIQKEYETQT